MLLAMGAAILATTRRGEPGSKPLPAAQTTLCELSPQDSPWGLSDFAKNVPLQLKGVLDLQQALMMMQTGVIFSDFQAKITKRKIRAILDLNAYLIISTAFLAYFKTYLKALYRKQGNLPELAIYQPWKITILAQSNAIAWKIGRRTSRFTFMKLYRSKGPCFRATCFTKGCDMNIHGRQPSRFVRV